MLVASVAHSAWHTKTVSGTPSFTYDGESVPAYGPFWCGETVTKEICNSPTFRQQCAAQKGAACDALLKTKQRAS